MSLLEELASATYRKSLQAIKQQDVDERHPLDLTSASNLVEILKKEAKLDGGSQDFFTILSVVFDYAFERKRTRETINDLTYLIQGGLIAALTFVYNDLSRQLIVEGQKVDRSLGALCKTCLSVFEEIPSARKEFSIKCLASIYLQWFVPGLKQPHPTTVYNIMEVSVSLLKEKDALKYFWTNLEENLVNLFKFTLDQVRRTILVSQQVLYIISTVKDPKAIQNAIRVVSGSFQEEKLRSTFTAAMKEICISKQEDSDVSQIFLDFVSSYYKASNTASPEKIRHLVKCIRFGEESYTARTCFTCLDGISSLIQVDESGQEIEPEIFYLDYNQISEMKVEKRVVQLNLAERIHPCVEKFFSDSQNKTSKVSIDICFETHTNAKSFENNVKMLRFSARDKPASDKLDKVPNPSRKLEIHDSHSSSWSPPSESKSNVSARNISNQYIESLNVKQLKDELRKHGQSTFGLKEVLCERLKALNINMSRERHVNAIDTESMGQYSNTTSKMGQDKMGIARLGLKDNVQAWLSNSLSLDCKISNMRDGEAAELKGTQSNIPRKQTRKQPRQNDSVVTHLEKNSVNTSLASGGDTASTSVYNMPCKHDNYQIGMKRKINNQASVEENLSRTAYSKGNEEDMDHADLLASPANLSKNACLKLSQHETDSNIVCENHSSPATSSSSNLIEPKAEHLENDWFDNDLRIWTDFTLQSLECLEHVGSCVDDILGCSALDCSQATTRESTSVLPINHFVESEEDEALSQNQESQFPSQIYSQDMSDANQEEFSLSFKAEMLTPLSSLQHVCKKYEQDKSSELLAISSKENLALKLKLDSNASKFSKHSLELSRRVNDIRKVYHDRIQKLKLRSKSYDQKHHLSVSILKESTDMFQRLKLLKQKGTSLIQSKFKAATQRIKSIKEWQAAEEKTLKGKILTESKSSTDNLHELQRLLGSLFQA